MIRTLVNTLRYFPTQLRDRLVTRGVATVLISTLFMLEPLLRDYSHLRNPPSMETVLTGALDSLLVFAILITTYGVIGEDVRKGYFRNVFSKPAYAPLYYIQELVTAALTVAVVVLLAIGTFAIVREPVWPGVFLQKAAFELLLLASLIFAWSRLHGGFDWLLGVAFYAFGSNIRALYPPDDSLYGAIFNVVMPPSHLFGGGLVTATGVDASSALWVVGYSLACITIGLLLIRFMAFGTQRS